MSVGLFLKIITTFLCAFFTWFYFETISSNPFLVLILGSLFIYLYFFLSDCKNISIKSIRKNLHEKKESGIELFLNHPAKMIVVYLASLSLIGGLLLNFPFSQLERVKPIDAFFTAVSATCVAGLSPVDIGTKFSYLGQIIILVLIQLGGLGIMSIASIVIHNVGKISFKSEVILTSDLADEMGALKRALIYMGRLVFFTELIGATILSFLFYLNGVEGAKSIYKGIFTAISAFCNAGFFLEANSLISYNTSPLILLIISLLIIIGSISPVATMLFPKFLMQKKISPQAKISLTTTISLLIVGTASLLLLEWNNTLCGLDVLDKISNAWFMSASVRTAGFTSLNISNIKDITYIIFLIFMFIGGSPGGIAGGIKTTTFAILILTFWSVISNQRNIVVEGREIRRDTVYKAITILIATLIVGFTILLMLLATQDIPTKLLLFEAVSALATSGISLDATSKLDEIGKVIIMFAMFIGKVGPLTLFNILKGRQNFDGSKYPVAKITLT